jgi:hypothetical protein
MSERAVTFGARNELVGILSVPLAPATSADRPAILTWNVGINHRVGPFRIYVDLARRIAASGFTSLRFDVSGRGDSEARREAVSDAEREALDVRDAMDFVTRRTGVSSFVLIGFCSSVDAAHRVSVADPRVVGAIQLEGYAYRTRGFRLRLPLRLLSARRWERYLKHRLSGLLPGLGGGYAQLSVRETVYKRDYPDWAQFTRDLEALVARGVGLLFVYVGGDTDYNHRAQFFKMFGSARLSAANIAVDYYPNSDHTFFGVGARRAIVERVDGWLNERFPGR